MKHIDFPEKELGIIDILDDESLEELEGRNLVFYDSHHGTAWKLNRANIDDIQRLFNAYTVIIVL